MKKVKKVLIALIIAGSLLSFSSAQAGPLACVGATGAGVIISIWSLFTGPGVFVVVPATLGMVALACVAPTP